jgi:hypothetical protein
MDASVFLYAFDLIELNGDDLRREPLAVRKSTLASVVAKASPGLRLNEHLEYHDGELVFRHVPKLPECEMSMFDDVCNSTMQLILILFARKEHGSARFLDQRT